VCGLPRVSIHDNFEVRQERGGKAGAVARIGTPETQDNPNFQ